MIIVALLIEIAYIISTIQFKTFSPDKERHTRIERIKRHGRAGHSFGARRYSYELSA